MAIKMMIANNGASTTTAYKQTNKKRDSCNMETSSKLTYDWVYAAALEVLCEPAVRSTRLARAIVMAS